MKKPDIWMPFYVDDYLGATTRFTTQEHGAYILLLFNYWKDGPIPNELSLLCRVTKMTPKSFQKASKKVLDKFILRDGFWHHVRVEKERRIAGENKSKYQERAKKGAQARWKGHAKSNPSRNASSNPSSNTPDMLEAMLKQCSPTSILSNSLPSSNVCSTGERAGDPAGRALSPVARAERKKLLKAQSESLKERKEPLKPL